MHEPAPLVKELREKTGAGLLDCKKALGEAEGDVEKALRAPARDAGSPRPPRRPRARPPTAPSARTSTPAARSACWSRSTARPTSSPGPTSSSSSCAISRCRSRRRARATCAARRSRRPSSSASARSTARRPSRAASPPQVIERIVDGQVERIYKDVCLLEQAFIKQSDRTVERRRAGGDRPARGEHHRPPLRALPARGVDGADERSREGEPRWRRARSLSPAPASPARRATAASS